MELWDGFRGEIWQEEINVRDFIQKNYTPYDGDESFLTGPTSRTEKLWNHVQKLQKEEREKGGVLECETEVVSGLTAYGPGYISEDMKDLEQIVGLQTDKPLKRAIYALRWNPYGSAGSRNMYDDVIRMHLDMRMRSARITWFRFWTDILHRMPIT